MTLSTAAAAIHQAPAPETPTQRRGSGFGDFFRYHGWLSPGVRIFRSLSFPAKAAWVSLSFVVPLALALVSVVAENTAQRSTTQLERDGVRYARPLMVLVQAAQLRRVSATLKAPDLAERQVQVKAAFDALRVQHAELGHRLQVDKPFGALQTRHEALLKDPIPGDADTTFNAHVAFTHEINLLLREIADGARLSLDPELDTHHLMNVALLRGPRLEENTARIRGLGALALSAGELSPQRRALIAEWAAVRGFLDEEVRNSLQLVVSTWPEIGQSVDFKAADAHTAAFSKAIASQLLGPQLAGTAADFQALGTHAIDGQVRLNLALLARLDVRLQQRIERLNQALYTQLVTTLLCLSLAGYLMLVSYRVLMGGLREVTGHLEEITKGNLTTCPRPWGSDEAARLMVTMGNMQHSLRRIVGVVLDGAGQVQLSSREIAAACTDLTARSEHAAADLAHTATSMAQIASTVQQTTATVEGAMAIVRENANAATRGGEVISQVVSTMTGIQTSSNRIGEIIGVIDGIAFQTNILALNAAVEAARAGEQGRGFAVVASEVRALAGRSAAAAREIKTLITASIEQVDSGNRVVAEAGTTIGDIVTNADRITGLMTQISTAAHEQAAGVGQVGASVRGLDKATQRNAALVEETSVAASALSDQASRLAAEVGFFKLK